MAKKIKRKHNRSWGYQQGRIENYKNPDFLEVGQGKYRIITINRHNGIIVVHRFSTKEEAQQQHLRNIEYDQALVGISEYN